MSKNNLLIIFLIAFAFITLLVFLFKNDRILNYRIEFQTLPSRSNIFKKLNSQTKYIRYECKSNVCGGWSDRLDGIISALALAIIQNRKFLITMTQPCQITNLLESNLINWETQTGSLKLAKTYSLYSIDDFNLINKMKTLNLKNFLNNYDLITVRNNQNWLKSFSVNPSITDAIKQLGYNQSEFRTQFIFKEWYNALFKLKPEMNKRYQKFLNLAKPNNETKLVCAQVRLGGSSRKNHASDWKFNERNVTGLIWNFIRTQFITKLNSKKEKYKIFVTTDDEDVQKEALNEFGPTDLVVNSGDIVHIDRDVYNLNDCEKIEKTILDFHCLQNCDMAVISNSGFGKMGLWNREKPIENLYLFTSNLFLKFNQSELFYTA